MPNFRLARTLVSLGARSSGRWGISGERAPLETNNKEGHMNRNIVSLLKWVGPQVLIAVAVFFAADSAARHQENQDLRKQSQIWASYVSQPELKMTGIAVAVHGGEAVLTGSVTSPRERVLAEKIALA